MLLSELTILNRLPELLIKDFNISSFNSNRTPNCDFIDDANITLNGICRDVLHLSGRGKYALTNKYKLFLIFFRSSSEPTDVRAQGNSHVTEKQILQGNLQILKDAIFYYSKNPIITYLTILTGKD